MRIEIPTQIRGSFRGGILLLAIFFFPCQTCLPVCLIIFCAFEVGERGAGESVGETDCVSGVSWVDDDNKQSTSRLPI